MHFGEKYSLLQKTIQRYLLLVPPSDLLIITNQNYFHLVKSQVSLLDPTLEKQILIEPDRKNTAPAICLGVKYLEEKCGVDPSECFLVSSSDHLIFPEDLFLQTLKEAEENARLGHHMVFGIRPQKPETGYGYIKVENPQINTPAKVEAFVEKPDYARAKEYVESGSYLWNSGIFFFQISSFLKEMEQFCPEIMKHYSNSFQEMLSHFGEMPDISIDYALLEKTARAFVIPLEINWSDIGSWDSVYDALEKDENLNVKRGNILDIDTKQCLILGGKRLIATIGLEDLLIIETDDALFIGKKGESQRVKQLVDALKEKNAKESSEHVTSHRPWGSFTVLEEGERYKIKRIVVLPQQRLSLQMHYHRSEHWVVVKGTAKVTIGEEEQLIHENEGIYISKSQVHRLENPGKVPLELIEVQVGEYVGEDDIVRLSDIYERI